MIESSEAWLGVVFYIVLAVCILMVLNAGFVFYLFAENDYRMLWTMTLLRTTAALMFGPLYIPWYCAFPPVLRSSHVQPHR